jgi:2-phosphosulfolactate phosphatase
MRNINVCLSTSLFPLYNEGNKLVVVVDILRATTVISTAFNYGIKDLIPVSELEEAQGYLNKEGYIVAAERNAEPIEGIPYGNSPFQYMNEKVRDKTLVLTTTNGTKAIHLSKHHEVITASFVNINAVFNYILQSDKDVIIFCSGWKGLPNMEDTIFAGQLSEMLMSSKYFSSKSDSLLSSISLYKSSVDDMFSFLEHSAHRIRLKHLNMEQDTKFCLSPNLKSEIIPLFKDGKLIPYEK